MKMKCRFLISGKTIHVENSSLILLFFSLSFCFRFTCVYEYLHEYVYVYHVPAHNQKGDIKSPRTGLMDSFELLCWCELNLGLLEHNQCS